GLLRPLVRPALRRRDAPHLGRLLHRVPGDDAVGERLVGVFVLTAAERLRPDFAEVTGDLLGTGALSEHPPDALEIRVVGVRARGIVVHPERVPVLDREQAQLREPLLRPPGAPPEQGHQFSVTQTAPSPAAIPRGRRPTGPVPDGRSLAGSIRTTVPFAQATHTEPSPYATARAFSHAGMLALIPERRGSMRSTVPSLWLIQTDPPPATTPV